MRTVRVSFSVVMAALAGGFLGSIVFSGGGTHAASATTVQPAASSRCRTTSVSYWLALQPKVCNRTFMAAG